MDGLRAVPAGAVFLTHVGFLTGWTDASALGVISARLNIGVAIFFVLSGFLLYRPFVRARLTGTPTPASSRYALRRAARILPAYWLALVVLGLALPTLVTGVFGEHWWVYLGLLQVYSEHWIIQGIPVAWSLSTEVSFYLVLPLVAWSVTKALARRPPPSQVRIELLLLLVTSVLAFGVREYGHRAGWSATFDNTVIGKWPWFAVGLALAVMSTALETGTWSRLPVVLRNAREHPWRWWLAALLVFAASTSTALLPQRVFTMTSGQLQLETLLFTIIVALCAAPLVFANPAHRRTPATLLSHRLSAWFGTISYGVFLWHYPLIGWLHGEMPGAAVPVIGVLALALTIACASGSWYLLERPVLAWAHGRRARAGPGAGHGTVVSAMLVQKTPWAEGREAPTGVASTLLGETSRGNPGLTCPGRQQPPPGLRNHCS